MTDKLLARKRKLEADLADVNARIKESKRVLKSAGHLDSERLALFEKTGSIKEVAEHFSIKPNTARTSVRSALMNREFRTPELEGDLYEEYEKACARVTKIIASIRTARRQEKKGNKR